MRQKKKVERNYEIHEDPSMFKESKYIEIANGRHSENIRNKGSIFINVDSFLVIVGIFKKHYSKYDNYEMKNISRTTGIKIVINLREVAEKILSCKGPEILKVLEYKNDKSPNIINEFIKSKELMSKMIFGIANYIEKVYENNEWICVVEV